MHILTPFCRAIYLQVSQLPPCFLSHFHHCFLTHFQQVSFSASPAASRARTSGSASPAHSNIRGPAIAAAAAAASTLHQHLSPPHDDFSFRVLVPAQTASHFNFLSQVGAACACQLNACFLLTLSCSSSQKSRNSTIDFKQADSYSARITLSQLQGSAVMHLLLRFSFHLDL